MKKRKKKKSKIIKKTSKSINFSELKHRIDKLQLDIDNQKYINRKEYAIRNLKIFGTTCKFIYPYILSTSLIVGGIKVLGGGFPIIKDDIKKYNKYTLECDKDGSITYESEYQSFNPLFEQAQERYLKVTFPFEYNDENITRIIREYDYSEFNFDDIDAILSKNFAYIKNNIGDYKEQIEVWKNLDTSEKKECIEANIEFIDKKDYIKVRETSSKNTMVTLLNCFAILGFGALITNIRKFQYLEKCKNINSNCEADKKALEDMKVELENLQNKLLSLKKGGR